MSQRFPPNHLRSLAVAAAASILLAAYVMGGDDAVRESTPSPPARARVALHVAIAGADAPRALPQLDLEKLSRVKSDEPAVNLFNTEIRVPPPPAPAVPLAPATPVPPPAPSAPSLPFLYVGKLIDGDRLVIFLSRQDTKYGVSAGDVIDNSYRVDQVSESAVEFTYLPLNIKQTLTINPPL
jgi:hypothetical protein